MAVNRYPDNMNIIAELYANDKLAPEGVYTVGAFINDECGGVGKYVDGKIFLTINGDVESGVEVVFKAFDNTNGKELDIADVITFNNAVYGNMATPYRLTISDATAIEAISASNYNIYPRPLRNRMFINGPTENIQSVTMVTVNGVKVLNKDGYDSQGIDISSVMPGTYAVILTTENGIYVDKVIKVE